MSLLERYSLEWKEDPTSRDEPSRGEAPGQRGACCPLLSPLPPSLPSFFPSSHTSHCQWELEAKWKKKSIYYRPFTLIYHWIICLHSQNPTKWFSLVMWFTCILKLHATPSRSQRHKCVLSLTEQAQLKQIKSKMHMPSLGLCKM